MCHKKYWKNTAKVKGCKSNRFVEAERARGGGGRGWGGGGDAVHISPHQPQLLFISLSIPPPRPGLNGDLTSADEWASALQIRVASISTSPARTSAPIPPPSPFPSPTLSPTDGSIRPRMIWSHSRVRRRKRKEEEKWPAVLKNKRDGGQ